MSLPFEGQPARVEFVPLKVKGYVVHLHVGERMKSLRVDKWTKPCLNVAKRLIREWLKKPPRPKPLDVKAWREKRPDAIRVFRGEGPVA